MPLRTLFGMSSATRDRNSEILAYHAVRSRSLGAEQRCLYHRRAATETPAGTRRMGNAATAMSTCPNIPSRRRCGRRPGFGIWTFPVFPDLLRYVEYRA